MDNEVFFSIITITLNSESYLTETIESVISQDYPHKEHIIIDGGSTDGTHDILKDFADDVKCISEPDNGIADAMNKGIRISKGNILSHLHSDDRYLPGTLSQVSRAFLQQPEKMWLYGNGEYIDEEGRRIKEKRLSPYSYRALKKLNTIFHPSVFTRKAVFEEVGYFDCSLDFAMDYEMWLKIGKFFDPIQLNEPLASFRVHSKSASIVEHLKAFDEEYQVRKKNCQFEHIGDSFFNYLRYKVLRYVKRFKVI